MPAFHSSLNKMAGLQWLFSPPHTRARAHRHTHHACRHIPTHPPLAHRLSLFFSSRTRMHFPHAHNHTHDRRSLPWRVVVSAVSYVWKVVCGMCDTRGDSCQCQGPFLPYSNKWQNQWCTVIQQCNSFHWLWLLARSAICLLLSLSLSRLNLSYIS